MYLRLKLEFVKTLKPFFHFLVKAFILSELMLYRFYLLSEVVFLLIFCQLLLYLLVDIVFDLYDLDLARDKAAYLLKPLYNICKRKYFLLVFSLDVHMRSYDISEPSRLLYSLDAREYLL